MSPGKGVHPIENYGVIGDMRSIALVSVEGSIDFLCYPNFDSPTIFAALLDPERGGSFALNPECEDMRVKQLYLPNTNILLTRLLSEKGVAEITDFMPVGTGPGRTQATIRPPHHPCAARDQGGGALRDALRAAIRLRPIGPPRRGGSRRGHLHAGLFDVFESGAARNLSADDRWHRCSCLVHFERRRDGDDGFRGSAR